MVYFDGVSYPIKGNKYHENYINFFKKKLVEKNINKIYTIEPYGKNTFDFVFKLDCVETLKINEILFFNIKSRIVLQILNNKL